MNLGVHTSTVRRHDSAVIDTSASISLRSDHPAALLGHTIFPASVVGTMESPRFLVSGHNNPKLGKTVLKGPRAGWPIFHLTLEERATCPRSCHAYLSCYGSAMPYARRHRVDGEFLDALRAEILTTARAYPGGILVRLHTLGDFYSPEYVLMWGEMLARLPQLHIFGYTARSETEDDDQSRRTAMAIRLLADAQWDRFAIRFSRAEPGPGRSSIFDEDPGLDGVIMCPAQTHRTEACATCGLCWSPSAKDKTIGFLRHGMKRAPKPVKRSGPYEFKSRGVTKREILTSKIEELLPSLIETHPDGLTAKVLMEATGEAYTPIAVAAAWLHRHGRAWWLYTGAKRAGKVLLPKTGVKPPPRISQAQRAALEHMEAVSHDGVYSGGLKAVDRAAGTAPGTAVMLLYSLERKGLIECVERGEAAKQGSAGTPSKFRLSPQSGLFRQSRFVPPQPARAKRHAAARPDASRGSWQPYFHRSRGDDLEPKEVVTGALMGDPVPGQAVSARMSDAEVAEHNARILGRLKGLAPLEPTTE